MLIHMENNMIVVASEQAGEGVTPSVQQLNMQLNDMDRPECGSHKCTVMAQNCLALMKCAARANEQLRQAQDREKECRLLQESNKNHKQRIESLQQECSTRNEELENMKKVSVACQEREEELVKLMQEYQEKNDYYEGVSSTLEQYKQKCMELDSELSKKNKALIEVAKKYNDAVSKFSAEMEANNRLEERCRQLENRGQAVQQQRVLLRRWKKFGERSCEKLVKHDDFNAVEAKSFMALVHASDQELSVRSYKASTSEHNENEPDTDDAVTNQEKSQDLDAAECNGDGAPAAEATEPQRQTAASEPSCYQKLCDRLLTTAAKPGRKRKSHAASESVKWKRIGDTVDPAGADDDAATEPPSLECACEQWRIAHMLQAFDRLTEAELGDRLDELSKMPQEVSDAMKAANRKGQRKRAAPKADNQDELGGGTRQPNMPRMVAAVSDKQQKSVSLAEQSPPPVPSSENAQAATGAAATDSHAQQSPSEADNAEPTSTNAAAAEETEECMSPTSPAKQRTANTNSKPIAAPVKVPPTSTTEVDAKKTPVSSGNPSATEAVVKRGRGRPRKPKPETPANEAEKPKRTRKAKKKGDEKATEEADKTTDKDATTTETAEPTCSQSQPDATTTDTPADLSDDMEEEAALAIDLDAGEPSHQQEESGVSGSGNAKPHDDTSSQSSELTLRLDVSTSITEDERAEPPPPASSEQPAATAEAEKPTEAPADGAPDAEPNPSAADQPAKQRRRSKTSAPEMVETIPLGDRFRTKRVGGSLAVDKSVWQELRQRGVSAAKKLSAGAASSTNSAKSSSAKQDSDRKTNAAKPAASLPPPVSRTASGDGEEGLSAAESAARKEIAGLIDRAIKDAAQVDYASHHILLCVTNKLGGNADSLASHVVWYVTAGAPKLCIELWHVYSMTIKQNSRATTPDKPCSLSERTLVSLLRNCCQRDAMDAAPRLTAFGDQLMEALTRWLMKNVNTHNVKLFGTVLRIYLLCLDQLPNVATAKWQDVVLPHLVAALGASLNVSLEDKLDSVIKYYTYIRVLQPAAFDAIYTSDKLKATRRLINDSITRVRHTTHVVSSAFAPVLYAGNSGSGSETAQPAANSIGALLQRVICHPHSLLHTRGHELVLTAAAGDALQAAEEAWQALPVGQRMTQVSSLLSDALAVLDADWRQSSDAQDLPNTLVLVASLIAHSIANAGLYSHTEQLKESYDAMLCAFGRLYDHMNVICEADDDDDDDDAAGNAELAKRLALAAQWIRLKHGDGRQ